MTKVCWQSGQNFTLEGNLHITTEKFLSAKSNMAQFSSIPFHHIPFSGLRMACLTLIWVGFLGVRFEVGGQGGKITQSMKFGT